MKKNSKRKGGPTIEAGNTSSGKVWIGASQEMYEFVKKPLSGSELHILVFDIEDAKAAVQMLQTEIARLE